MKRCGKCQKDVEPVAVGTYTLACGDSTDGELVARLFHGEKARLVWTDPPYGVGYEEKNAHLWAWDGRARRPSQAQSVAHDGDVEEAWSVGEQALVHAAAHSVPGGVAYVAAPAGAPLQGALRAVEVGGYVVHQVLIWLKDAFVFSRCDYHYRHEPVIYAWKGDGAHYFVDDHKQDTVFEVPRPRKSEEHPTMKPVELVARMVANSSEKGDLVYDPFTGSGTTLLACAQLGRRFVGCEFDPRYADVIRRRATKFLRSAGVDPGPGALE